MFYLYAVCAAVGCTILVFQFIMSVIGMAGDSLNVDVGDMDVDMDVDMGVDLDMDADVDMDTGNHPSPNWLLGVLSFKTVVAFFAFFGLGGLTADALKFGPLPTIAVAMAAGMAALYAVYYLFYWIARIKSDGTPRIRYTLGREATVYTTIPAEGSGTGKIQMNLQERTMEFLAQTDGPKLSPGSLVLVTAVLSPGMVRVQAATE